MEKIDLSDVTFIFPVRIDSIVRMENTSMSIEYILKNFKTSVIVINADKYDNSILKRELNHNIKYIFVEDYDNVFHRTRFINEMVHIVNTAYVAIWDVDVIVPKYQIENAVKRLREGYDVVYPYNFFLDTSKIVRELYFKLRIDDILIANSGKMNMVYGPEARGGAFLINLNSYCRAGLENVNFYGWGPEDSERYERWKQLDYKVYICDGYLFHLTHERGHNSGFRTNNQTKQTYNLYYRTKSSSKEEIYNNLSFKEVLNE